MLNLTMALNVLAKAVIIQISSTKEIGADLILAMLAKFDPESSAFLPVLQTLMLKYTLF
jgi:hypothetical protein